MRWLVSLINSTIVRAVTIFLSFLALFSALKEFSVVDFSFLGVHALTYFLIFAVTSFILAFIITLLLRNLKVDTTITPDPVSLPSADDILRKINNRISSKRSLEIVHEDEVDFAHKYSHIWRYDIIDYEDKAYRSIRVLQGINASKDATNYILYCESTEYRVSFGGIKILAFDVVTGKKLKVECCHAEIDELSHTHRFRIYFDKPLAPTQPFNIAYYIEFPDELNCLNKNNEIMSISLVRFKQKLGKLSFSVFMNFDPDLIRLHSYEKKSGKCKIIPNQRGIFNGKCSQETIYLRNDILDKFPFTSGKTFSIVEMEIPDPKSSMYIIEYFRSPN